MEQKKSNIGTNTGFPKLKRYHELKLFASIQCLET